MGIDHIAELALIEMSRLQRYAIVFAIDDDAAKKISMACLDEIARRDTPAFEHEQQEIAA